jgi:mannose-6-phosphate isomerase-like protein (cupin superfamily)
VRDGLFKQMRGTGHDGQLRRCVHLPSAAWFNWRLARYAFGRIGFDGNDAEPAPRRVGHKGVVMKGFVQDIEDLAVKNDEFRRVLYTAKHCQLVVMALKPQEEIGAEVHTLDQFFRVEAGAGEAILDGVRTAIRAGFAVVVPAGANHNIINTGTTPLKLYTLYAPPNHRDRVVHHTRDDAEADSEHFDGQTTE